MIEWVFVVVIVCSIVQSVFGMGLLVFGTPSLLLMGLEFTDALGYLLPASIAISAIQVCGGQRPTHLVSPNLWVFCVPMIGVGLALSIFAARDLPVDRIVGVVLILSVASVVASRLRQALMLGVKRYSWLYHAAMGFVHGLSNMGGSLLSVYAAGIGRDKSETRFVVACYYLVFSIFQVMVLLATGRLELSYNLATPIVSAAVYLAFGNRVFGIASEPAYRSLFTAFMAAYGAVLLVG